MVDRNAELRATVRKLETNAKRKVNRNKAKGIAGVNTFTPVRPSIDLGSLNKRQLTTYSHQLQRFNSRRNQFLADANGEALPSRAWKAYKRKENAYNAKVNAIFDEVKGLTLPNGQSIKDRMNIITPDHPAMANQAVNALFRPTSREVSAVNGMHGLDRLNKLIDKKLAPDYFAERRKGDKEALGQMLDMLGDDELTERVGALTDKQFDTLWNYTEFVTDIVLNYESAKQALRTPNAKKEAWLEALDSGLMDSAYEHVKWVENNV